MPKDIELTKANFYFCGILRLITKADTLPCIKDEIIAAWYEVAENRYHITGLTEKPAMRDAVILAKHKILTLANSRRCSGTAFCVHFRMKTCGSRTRMAFSMYISLKYMYSILPLIRPPYLPRNCGDIREVAFGEREN